MSTGYDTPLIGFVQAEFALHAMPTLVMCEAEAGNWPLSFTEMLNLVEVIIIFQPLPTPRASVTAMGKEYVTCLTLLSTSTFTLLVDSDFVKVPPVIVTWIGPNQRRQQA